MVRGWNLSFRIIGGCNLSGWKLSVYTQEGSVNYNIRSDGLELDSIGVGFYRGWNLSGWQLSVHRNTGGTSKS